MDNRKLNPAPTLIEAKEIKKDDEAAILGEEKREQNLAIDTIKNIILNNTKEFAAHGFLFKADAKEHKITLDFCKLIQESITPSFPSLFCTLKGIESFWEKIHDETVILLHSQNIKKDLYSEGLFVFIYGWELLCVRLFLKNNIPVLNRASLENEKNELLEKKKKLNDKIILFNKALHDAEMQYERTKVCEVDYGSSTLTDLLEPLLSQENRGIEKLQDEVPTNEFEEKRGIIRNEISYFQKITATAINECQIILAEKNKAHKALYQFYHKNKNQIDPYYLKAFEKENPEKLKSYLGMLENEIQYKKMLDWTGRAVKFTDHLARLRMLVAEFNPGWFKDSMHKMREEVKKFLPYFPKSEDDQFVPIIKANEDVVYFIKNAFPGIKKLVADQFFECADAFKNTKDDEQRNELEDYKKAVNLPIDEENQLAYINFSQIKIKKLNAEWEKLFQTLLTKALNDTFEMTKLLSLKAREEACDASLLSKKEEIIPAVLIHSGFYQARQIEILQFLNNAYAKAKQDLKEKMDYLKKNRVTRLFEKKETPIVLSVPKKQDESSHEPWYASLMDTPWKKALWCGALALILTLSALTVWGLIVHLSIALVLLTGAGAAGVSTGSLWVMQSAHLKHQQSKRSVVSHEDIFMPYTDFVKSPSQTPASSKKQSYDILLPRLTESKSSGSSISITKSDAKPEEPVSQVGWWNAWGFCGNVYGFFGYCGSYFSSAANESRNEIEMKEVVKPK